jgi:hypothetical protein
MIVFKTVRFAYVELHIIGVCASPLALLSLLRVHMCTVRWQMPDAINESVDAYMPTGTFLHA